MIAALNAVNFFGKYMDWNPGSVKTVMILIQVLITILAAVIIFGLVYFAKREAKKSEGDKVETGEAVEADEESAEASHVASNSQKKGSK